MSTPGPFDEEWVRAAARTEESAEVRAARHARIAAEHERATGWRTAPPPPVEPRSRRAARWTTAVVALVLLAVLAGWLLGSGRPLFDAGPLARLDGDNATRQQEGMRPIKELPPAGADAAADRILPAVVPPPEAGEFRFMSRQGGEPITYSPCRRLEVVVNTAGAPPDALAAVTDAVAQISAASGLSLTVGDTTTEPYRATRKPFQPNRYGERWAPIIVQWQGADTVPEFDGTTVGLGGSTSIDPGLGRTTYVTGDIVLNRDHFADPGNQEHLTEVLLHEFGHVLGLDHVSDAEQVMWVGGVHGAGLGTGDRAGLARLGQGPCTPRL